MGKVSRILGVFLLTASVLAGCKTTENGQQNQTWQTARAAGFPVDMDIGELSNTRRLAFEGIAARRDQLRSAYYTAYRYQLRTPGRLLSYIYAPVQPGAGWNEPDSLSSLVRDDGGVPETVPGSAGSFGADFGGRVEYMVFTINTVRCLKFRSYFGQAGGDNRLAGTKLVQGDYCGSKTESLGEADAREFVNAMVLK